MDDVTEGPHYQVAFFSKDELFSNLPDKTFTVPSTITPENVNALANKALEETSGSEGSEKKFDFLINSVLLRGTLDTFVEEQSISTESVIHIECILHQPAPKPGQDLPASDWVSAVKMSSTNIFAVTYDGSLTVWNRDGKEVLSSYINTRDQPAKCLDFITSAADFRLAVGFQDQVIIISDVLYENGSITVEPVEILRGHERNVECLSANKDGDRLVSGGFDSNLKVWNCLRDDESTKYIKMGESKTKKQKTNFVTKTPMVTLAGHKDAIVDIRWLPFSKKEVVTASWDKTIRIWDLELAGEKDSLSTLRAFTSISVCPTNGMFITGSVDPVVRLWDPRSHEGSLVKQSFLGHTGWVSCVNWSPNKENLFISGSFDNTLKLWDIRSGKTPLYDLKGHTDRILCCDWSEKDIVASGSVDCTVKTFLME